MINITTLERKLKAVRSRKKYQTIRNLAEELEKETDPDRHNMIKVCRFVTPSLSQKYCDSLSDAKMKNEFNESLEYVKKPYACIHTSDDGTIEYLLFERLNEALDYAHIRWRNESLLSENRDHINDTYTVAEMVADLRVYCVFSNDCDLDNVVRILQVEHADCRYCYDSYIFDKFISFAEKADPEFENRINSHIHRNNEDMFQDMIQEAEKVLNVSITKPDLKEA